MARGKREWEEVHPFFVSVELSTILAFQRFVIWELIGGK